MKLYRDDSNCPRAEADGDLALLAGFLESDIQEDKRAAIDLLQFLEKKQGVRTGNAYELTFTDTHVILQALEGDEARVEIGRNLFFQAVEGWIVFISD